jgi:hypothetical protein
MEEQNLELISEIRCENESMDFGEGRKQGAQQLEVNPYKQLSNT